MQDRIISFLSGLREVQVYMIKQLSNDEKFTNIQRAQAGLTRLFEDAQETGIFYRVMKNDEPLGVFGAGCCVAIVSGRFGSLVFSWLSCSYCDELAVLSVGHRREIYK